MNYIKLFEEFTRKREFTPEEVKIFIDYFNPILAEGRKLLDEKIESFLKSDSYFDHDVARPQPLWVNYEVKWLSGIQSFSDDYSRYVYNGYKQEDYNRLLGWAHLFYGLYETFLRSKERKLKDGTEEAKILYQYKIHCYIPSDIMIHIGRIKFEYNIARYIEKRLSRQLGDRYKLYAQVYDAYSHSRKEDKYIQIVISITDKEFIFQDPFK